MTSITNHYPISILTSDDLKLMLEIKVAILKILRQIEIIKHTTRK